MLVGLVLPHATDNPLLTVQAALRAEAEGFDGVFMYDHLHPINQPEEPSLSPIPVLAAAATETSLRIGTLVLRVGPRPIDEVLASVRSLQSVSDGRFIAGLGVSDALGAMDLARYQVKVPPVEERRDQLATCVDTLCAENIECWIGSSHSWAQDIAVRTGCSLNLWRPKESLLAKLAALKIKLTWAGLAKDLTDDAVLDALNARASWMVVDGSQQSPDGVDWPAMIAARQTVQKHAS